MAGGNHNPKGPHPPASSNSNRKTRWESNSTKSPNPKLNDPKTKPNPNPNPSPKHHPHAPSPGGAPFHFPDPPSLGPPPPPAYGFHMLERRTIVLADGSVRSYFALPPDYHDFAPPPHYYRNPPPPHEASAKRKFGDDDDLARQREQLLRNANLNGYPRGEFSAGPSGPLKRDLGDHEMRPSKHLRVDGVSKHHQVDQDALKKAFLHFAKLINENPNQKKSYLEDGKQGRLQCLACGRFDRGIHRIMIVSFKFVCFEFICSIERIVVTGERRLLEGRTVISTP